MWLIYFTGVIVGSLVQDHSNNSLDFIISRSSVNKFQSIKSSKVHIYDEYSNNAHHQEETLASNLSLDVEYNFLGSTDKNFFKNGLEINERVENKYADADNLSLGTKLKEVSHRELLKRANIEDKGFKQLANVYSKDLKVEELLEKRHFASYYHQTYLKRRKISEKLQSNLEDQSAVSIDHPKSLVTAGPSETYDGHPENSSLYREKRSMRETGDRIRKNLPNFLNETQQNSSKREDSNYSWLSKNISAILENLLKNYNTQERPGFQQGKSSVIKVNMLIRSMGPISEKDMRYSMDCYVRQEWQDDRLRFDGPLEKLTLNIKMLDTVWKPDTYFHNGHGSYVHTITRPNKLFRIHQTGKILYSMRLTVKAKCPMDLKNFPMDKQSCPLLIGSFAYPIKDVRYEWDENLVSFAPGMTLSQYDILNTECRNYSALWKKGGVYSVLRVNFNLQRHTGYFLIQVYIPCILIVVLSWVSFWINREATSDRIGLGITSVLSLYTIGLDTRSDLPKVHYATALDWFILLSFGYTMATLLQSGAVHYFTKIGYGEVSLEDSQWMDIEVDDSSPGDWNRGKNVGSSSSKGHCDVYIGEEVRYNNKTTVDSSCNVDSLETISSSLTFRSAETQTDRHDSFWSQMFHCIIGDDKYRMQRTRQALRENSVNSVSVIDTVSKVFFPASYGLVNLWYWYYYYHSEIAYSWSESGFDYLEYSYVGSK